LAIKEDKPMGMIGAAVSQANRYILNGMRVDPLLLALAWSLSWLNQ
jgi:hypothetical protein